MNAKCAVWRVHPDSLTRQCLNGLVVFALCTIALANADSFGGESDPWHADFLAARARLQAQRAWSFAPVVSPEMKPADPPVALTVELNGAQFLVLRTENRFQWGLSGYPHTYSHYWRNATLIARDGQRVRLADVPLHSVTKKEQVRVVAAQEAKLDLPAGFEHGVLQQGDGELVYELGGRFVKFEAEFGLNLKIRQDSLAVGRVEPAPIQREAEELRQRYGALARDWGATLERWLMERDVRPVERTLIDGVAKNAGALGSELTARKTDLATVAPDDDLRWLDLCRFALDVEKRVAFIREQIPRMNRKTFDVLRNLAARSPSPAQELDRFEAEWPVIQASLKADQSDRLGEADKLLQLRRQLWLRLLDAPLLFVKQQPYMVIHIYDTFLANLRGGGIYILENPQATGSARRFRTVIDPATPATLGEGVYRDPELTWDGARILFAFKNVATSLYEIGVDGTGLRQLTTLPPGGEKAKWPHDFEPHALPDGRIVFNSTRDGPKVPCNNTPVNVLHTMNADGTGLRRISVNHVNEFDPTVLPDGRILYGRWEYVDKSALYIQSLWTMNPDGSQEAALFANNLAKPTAILDARPIPGSSKIVATLTPHNGRPVGAIAILDPHVGKNTLAALTNLTPKYPTEMDQGLMQGPCDPWPLSPDVFLIANNDPQRGPHGVIEMISYDGAYEPLLEFPEISCYAPMLVKPRLRPPALPPQVAEGKPARFLVADVYRSLPGVTPGEVKTLRVLATTARTSDRPAKGLGAGNWWNQKFLVSWQGSYEIKDYLSIVPVHEDGSAFFEVPPDKPVYFQALDGNGRLLQSMRTFVRSTPGVTRSCVGCHVPDDNLAPGAQSRRPVALDQPPQPPQPESWGTGFLDYPTMVQPILDRHCVSCHGGPKGMAAGLDLSGGWTWAFNISYESLIKRNLVGFLNCENGAVKATEILPPRTHGSGAAPLTKLLLSGHSGRLPKIGRAEIDLLLAWMDGNGNYHGTYDYSEWATCDAFDHVCVQLEKLMKDNSCGSCHTAIGNDWVNLQNPEGSRILRAPLAKLAGGLGLALCRDRKATPPHPVVRNWLQPPDVIKPAKAVPAAKEATAVVSFANTDDPVYGKLLAIIQKMRATALTEPRVDMPGAKITPGRHRDDGVGAACAAPVESVKK